MRKRIMIWIVVAVAAAATGAVAGYLTAPRYTPPAAADEARLRLRAEQFYRGMQRMDFTSMSQIYTPARQLADFTELRQIATDRTRAFLRFQPDTRAEMLESVATINAADLTARIEGDWAVTGGKRVIYKDGQEIPVPLQPLVWLRTDGDWWVYQLKPPELQAYGSPPDFARDLLVEKSAGGLVPTGTPPAALEPPPQPQDGVEDGGE